MKRLLAALLALMLLLTMTSCAAPDAAETDDKLTLVAFNVGKADALLLDLRAQGKTILLASHFAQDIDALCDTVQEMAQGRIREV